MAEDDGKTKADTTVKEAPNPAESAITGDPVGEAERALEEAKRKLEDAKESAKRGDEVAKAKEQYRTEQVHLEAADAVLKTQLREGKENLAATPDEKKTVNTIKHKFDGHLSGLARKATTYRDALAVERGKLDDAKLSLVGSKAVYEGLKAQGKAVQTKHRGADALRKEGYDALGKQQRHLAYFLFKHGLEPEIGKDPKPIEVPAYDLKIDTAATAYGGDAKKIRDLELSVKELEKKLTDAEKALADFSTKYDAKIREELAKLP